MFLFSDFPVKLPDVSDCLLLLLRKEEVQSTINQTFRKILLLTQQQRRA